jgi:hypothetical protein
MASGTTKTTKYSYRQSSGGVGTSDVSIEYSADLSALSRLEVSNLHQIIFWKTQITLFQKKKLLNSQKKIT